MACASMPMPVQATRQAEWDKLVEVLSQEIDAAVRKHLTKR